MSTRDGGEPWFVARMSAYNPTRRRGIVPINRAGWMALAAFMIGEFAALILGAAIIVTMPEIMLVGIVVIVAGVTLSMLYLFTTIRTHTDYALTEETWRAQQARRG